MARRLFIAFGLTCLLLVSAGGLCPDSALAEDSFYSVHVGSFKKAENAARQAADFQARGYYAISRREHVDEKGDWHRVYVGQFTDYNEAQHLGASLVQQGVITSYTVRPVELTVTAGSAVPLPYTPETARRQTYEPTPPPAGQPWNYPQQAPPRRNQAPLPYAPVQVLQPIPGPNQQPSPGWSAPCYDEEPPLACTTEKGRVIQPADPQPVGSSAFDFHPQFMLGARTGLTRWNHPGDFVIIRNNGATGVTWNVTDDTGFHFALVPSVAFNQYFTLETSLERAWASEWALWSLTLDPKVTIPITNNLAGFFKLGLVWGTFSWDNTPGDFGSSFGWQMGTGLTWDFGAYRAGLGLGYRDIQFAYNSPGTNIWSTRDDIDMTSLSVSGSFEYKF